jgi:hypothetical protein
MCAATAARSFWGSAAGSAARRAGAAHVTVERPPVSAEGVPGGSARGQAQRAEGGAARLHGEWSGWRREAGLARWVFRSGIPVSCRRHDRDAPGGAGQASGDVTGVLDTARLARQPVFPPACYSVRQRARQPVHQPSATNATNATNGRTAERQNGRTAERQNGRTAERQNGRTAERQNGVGARAKKQPRAHALGCLYRDTGRPKPARARRRDA